MVASGAVLLSTPGVTLPSRVLRQVLGAFFRPTAAALAAGAGAIYGPSGQNGELTLLTDLLVRVNPAVFVINGTHNTKQGQYIVPNDDLVDLAVPAKDANQFRKAYIAVRVADSTEAGVAPGALTDVPGVLEVQPGALAAANPALPVQTANTLYLGELSIPSTASGQPVTITKYNPRAVLRGQVYPVADRAARLAIPVADRYPGLDVIELDKGRSWRWDGVGAGWDLIAGQKPHCAAYLASAMPMGGSVFTVCSWDGEDADTDNMHSIAGSTSDITVPETAYYLVQASLSWNPVGAGARVVGIGVKPGGVAVGAGVTGSLSGYSILRGAGMAVDAVDNAWTPTLVSTPKFRTLLNAGDALGVVGWQNGSSSINLVGLNATSSQPQYVSTFTCTYDGRA